LQFNWDELKPRVFLISGEKLYFHGEPSRFDRNRLGKELARCRQTGFAVDLGEMKTGIHAVASPVFGPGRKLVGSIVVMGTFSKQFSERYGCQVAKTARSFSETIGGTVQNPYQKSTRRKTTSFDIPRAKRED
jgi:DNA-binding IclR family transcriptional regulator